MNSERQFEHTEDKIKQAAENNLIIFEEDSWVKMEALLDKEGKKKPLAWLWFLLPFIVVSAIAVFTVTKNKKNNSPTNVSIQNKNKSIIFAQKDYAKKIPPGIVDNNLMKNKPKAIVNIKDNSSTKLKLTKDLLTQKVNKYVANKRTKKNSKAKKLNEENTRGLFSNKASEVKEDFKNTITIKNAEVSEDVQVDTVEKNNELLLMKKIVANDTIAKKDSNIVVQKTTEAKKKNKILSQFYILAAAGADASAVKLLSFANSKFVPKYGIAIGYNFTKKINVQAGFYASKKKYIAGPADYKVKAGSYWAVVPITKVEASCLVYEVPITLQYHFLQKKSFNVYMGVGVSSYIMKTEDYKYFYKRYNTEYTKDYAYSGNQHLFSSAFLSAGIEKNITKKIIVQLEPTVSVPLKGVGDGTIKLFSTSLLLGLKLKPFNK